MPEVMPLPEVIVASTEATTPPPIPVSPVEEEKKEPEKKPDNSRFAAISKKERQLLHRMKELQAKEKMLQEKYGLFEEVDKLKDTSKLEAIRRLGFSYEDLTNEFLNSQNPSPEHVARKTAEQLIKEQLDLFRKEQEGVAQKQQQDSYDRALAQIKGEAQGVVNTSNAYPLVKKFELYDNVIKTVEEAFQESSRIMPVEDALQEVENSIVNMIKEAIADESVRSKVLAPATPVAEQAKLDAAPAATNQQSKTLTHKSTAAPPSPKGLSYEEKKKRAMDIFYGRLPA